MRKLLLAFAAFAAVLLPGTPAWAHAQLVSAAPAKDARLTAAPATVELTFSERLNPEFATIAISDAARQLLPATSVIDDSLATVSPGRPLANGTYTVAYRVVSVDGHTVQGSYTFTVADPAQPVATAQAAAAPTPTGAGGSRVVLIGVIAAVVLLALLLGLFAFRRSARSVSDEAR